jgi:hypothetical protein
LKLSLVSWPVALFPASSEREKISFHQINEETGNRIKYRKVDAETGDEVDSEKILKGYEVGKGQYIQIEPEELEAIAIESKRTIEIDEFVPKKRPRTTIAGWGRSPTRAISCGPIRPSCCGCGGSRRGSINPRTTIHRSSSRLNLVTSVA